MTEWASIPDSPKAAGTYSGASPTALPEALDALRIVTSATLAVMQNPNTRIEAYIFRETAIGSGVFETTPRGGFGYVGGVYPPKDGGAQPTEVGFQYIRALGHGEALDALQGRKLRLEVRLANAVSIGLLAQTEP